MSAVIARRPQRSYTAAPAGTHHAVCVDVQNLGLVQSAWGQKHKVRLVWQIATVDETHQRRFELARLYTLSLHERAALRQDLERWRGKKFTDAELDAGFDLEKLIGVNCQLLATQDLGDDGTLYTNVASVLPAPVGVPKLFPLDFTRFKDRAPGRGTPTPADGPDRVPF
jgi:hypothetical protein